ncbi:hypothetical protein BH24ACT3_BH24ACT3_09670 [soil metagenome]
MAIVSTAVAATGPAASAQTPPVVSIAEVCAGSPTAPFPDRPSDARGEAVDCVAALGVARGGADGRFSPNAPVTRAQMASFLRRAAAVAGAGLSDGPPGRFGDALGAPHGANVDAIAAAGVAEGLPDGSFGSNRPVTRGQMASFLDRLVAYALGGTGPPPVPGPDRFTDDTGVHEAAINTIAALGITGGVAPGRFAPAATVSRGQMAMFLARTIAVLADRLDAPPARPGQLAVVTTGLPDGVPAAVTVSGPDGSQAATVTDDEAFTGTGRWTVSAEPVAFDGGMRWPTVRGGTPGVATGTTVSSEAVLTTPEAGAAVRVSYATFVPDPTVVLTDAQTSAATRTGDELVVDAPLVDGGHVVGQPVPEHPDGFVLAVLSTSGSSPTTAAVGPAAFDDAILSGEAERTGPLSDGSGTGTGQVGERRPCGPSAHLDVSYQFDRRSTANLDLRFGASFRPRAAVTVSDSVGAGVHLSTTAAATCTGVELPLPGLDGSEHRVGPVRLTLDRDASLRIAAGSGGRANVAWLQSWRVQSTIDLSLDGPPRGRMAAGGGGGGVRLGGAGSIDTGVVLDTGVQVRGGPFGTDVDTGVRLDLDASPAPWGPVCRLGAEAYTTGGGSFNGLPVTAPASPIPLTSHRCPALLRPGNPGTVAVVGDSVTYDAMHGLRAALSATGSVAKLVDRALMGFGLEANNYNWRRDFTDLVARHDPDLIIAFWGSWDLDVARREPARYRSMVEEASDLLTARGARVVWVGMLPSAKLDPYRREDTDLVNRVFSTLPRRHPGSIVYVDPDPIFAPGGPGSRVQRIERSPLTGRDELLRTPDHRHLCPAGSAIVADLALTAGAEAGWISAPTGTWWIGPWTADRRFYDRIGGCERA